MSKAKYTEENFIGRKFNRLVVLSYEESRKFGRYWKCSCACGTVKIIRQASLLSGSTESCGCLHKEQASTQKNRLRHGMTYTGLYNSWCHMKARCYYKDDVHYNNYGGRGIRVAQEWLVFDKFMTDMQAGWMPGLTIERKDVDKDYSKENCVWVKNTRQACNKTTTVWVDFDGVRTCLADASRLSGIPYSTLKNRVKAGVKPPFLFKKDRYVKSN